MPSHGPCIKIWTQNLWPKLSFFLWLLYHGKILTWDNMLKKGFQGPTICHLCKNSEETFNHLLSSFPYSSLIWDQGALLFHTSYRNKEKVAETISKWRTSTFTNTIVNRSSKLLLGFILWNIWKERNKRILKKSRGKSLAGG